MFVFRVLNTVPYTNRSGAKDLVAGVHSFLTSNLLIGLAVLISWKQFGGTPIECMVPLDFTSAWVQYSNNYCWAQPTYFIPFTSELVEQVIDPSDVVTDGLAIGAKRGAAPRVVKKGGEKISYYQWMSFFLLFEAACFRLPCFIWKYFASQSGMQVGEILRVASDENNAVPMVKKGNIEALCIHLRGVLRFQKRLKLKKIVPHKILRFLNIKYSAYYVTFIYFVAKFAFLLNVVLQSNLLNKYMLPNDRQQNFGFDMWKTIFYNGGGNETWRENGVFPRVTLCDFETRDMGNVQTHTVQCVLLLNLFTEKIFVFLWAWYIFLAAFTVANLVSWLFAVFNETYNEHFILNHLEMCETPFDKDDIKNREHVTRFIQVYLGTDGLFLLQLIAQHADVVFTTELIAALFKTYIEIEAQRKTLKQMNAVLPLLRPADENQAESALSTAPSTSHNVRRRGTEQMDKGPKSRQGSLSTNLRRFNSFEEPDVPTKKFDESSSEDEKESKKGSKQGSKKTSPSKKKPSVASTSNSRRPSLARALSPAFTQLQELSDKLPKTTERKNW